MIASKISYLALEALGVLLGIWAMWTMKLRNFNITPDIRDDTELVTDGPYNYIRHPMYSSLLLVTLALVFDRFSVFRFAIWLILLIDLVFKLHYEEEFLSKRFSEYSRYKEQTKRLIPFIL